MTYTLSPTPQAFCNYVFVPITEFLPKRSFLKYHLKGKIQRCLCRACPWLHDDVDSTFLGTWSNAQPWLSAVFIQRTYIETYCVLGIEDTLMSQKTQQSLLARRDNETLSRHLSINQESAAKYRCLHHRQYSLATPLSAPRLLVFLWTPDGSAPPGSTLGISLLFNKDALLDRPTLLSGFNCNLLKQAF